MCIIACKGLTKKFKTKIKQEGLRGSIRAMLKPEYKEVVAVNQISFTVDEGEILAFIGPNGAGKSTTIKMMTGVLYPTEGEISVMGYDPSRQRRQMAYHIGSVFGQKSQLWFHLPPVDSFKLLGSIYEVDAKTLKNRIDYLTEVFDIQDLLQIPVRKLSLGQRIRCEIAASLLHQPRIIFLDEPTIGLDVVIKQKIRELILKVNKEEKTTVFLTSHDAGDIEQLCKRAIIINNGQVVLNESVKNLKYHYMNKKIIDIKYTEKVNLDMTGATVLKEKGYSAKIEIDTKANDIDEITAYFLKAGKVSDITISDPPLEEIIADIYRGKTGRGDGDTGESA